MRITAKAPTEEEVQAVLAAEVDEVASILADYTFSTDDESMETVVLDLLRQQGLTLGTAESLTGGLIASRLTVGARRERRASAAASSPTPAR